MPNIVREDIDNLNAVLTVTIEKSEYEPRFNSELHKYKKQANLKGFRKGKTPLTVVKKMYGKSVLADVINEMLQKELYEYLSQDDIRILGQPLPSDEQEPVDFDVRNLDNYVFKFDLGLAPDFEVQGIGEESSYEKLKVEVTDEMADKDLQSARKRHGERTTVEEGIEESDLVKLKARELENGEVKEGGLETEFSILLSNVTNEEAKQQLLASKKEDVLQLNLFELEDRDEAYVRKYFLNLSDDDEREVNETYELTITEISRVEPAAVNQEFFDKFFGEGEVSTEEEALAKIREYMENFYSEQANALLFRDLQESLMEQNPMPLPEAFLKRWMKASNDNVTDAVVEKEYDAFAKNLQWSLIRGKLVRDLDVKVEREDVLENLKKRVRNYFGGSVPGMEAVVDSTAARLMEDQQQYEQAYEEVLTDKLFDALSEKINTTPKPVSLEEFEAEVEKARAAQSPAAEEEE